MEEIALTEDNISDFLTFHRAHFPGQPVPQLTVTSKRKSEEHHGSEADLGCYPDGVRRTLTDDQIALFRHSEIQRLLNDRRKRREREEGQTEKPESSDDTKQPRSAPPMSQSNKQTIFDTDATVHARNDVTQLTYEDPKKTTVTQSAKAFQWPVLGTS